MKNLNRREFLKITAGSSLAAVLALEGCAKLSSNSASKKPNIVFFIAEDLRWLDMGAYGNRHIETPVFDRMAREGVMFNHAYASAPSCCPARGALLTGQAFYRLREGAQNWCTLDKSFKTFPRLLEDIGYTIGLKGKSWGPGDLSVSGWKRDVSGDEYDSIEEFLDQAPADKPFLFTYGPHEAHRMFVKDSGIASGKKLEDADVPAFFPDCEEVRGDILDYYVSIETFDKNVSHMVKVLEERGLLENTLVIMTADHGFAFPRGKSNLYDAGTRVPLAIRWPGKIKAGRTVDDFIHSTDIAPTILEAMGLKVPCEMTGTSFFDLLVCDKCGKLDAGRDHAVFGRERHHPEAFEKNPSFPCRGIRTEKYLYIRNYKPGLSCGGTDTMYEGAVDTKYFPYPDYDFSPTKNYMLANRDSGRNKRSFDLCFGPRPAEELYDIDKDPDQMHNVASDPKYAAVRLELSERLTRELVETKDPRALGQGDVFDNYPVYAWIENFSKYNQELIKKNPKLFDKMPARFGRKK